MTKQREIKFIIIRSLLAIFIALLVAILLIFISTGGSTFQEKLNGTGEDLKQMLIGPLFRMSKKKGTYFEMKRLAEIFAAMIPTIFTGLSVCIMFSANQFNLGAEGGALLGAFVSAMVAIYVPLPAGVHAVVAVLIGGAAVAIVMLIPALLKTKLDVSEMVCSLMLNYIIMYVIKFLMNAYLADKSRGQVMSHQFLSTSGIAPLVNDTVFSGAKLTWGFPVAIVAVILCGLLMYRSRWGYSIRMIGINQSFAKYSGMKVGSIIVLSQILGGFLAGVGGGIEMLGRYTSFTWSALPGYGWTGITIAILAGNNPWVVPFAAFFMAYLSKGCDLMATYAQVPAQLIDIVQGVIFLFFAAEQFLARYRQRLVVKTAEEEIARRNLKKEG
ncbi:MAG: ABC transporter permease [Clostridia bacterium]|nr:ABC transporter permease [Clostridia bacterium]